MNTNIMLDLETMGLTPNSAIVAIGAVKFTATEILDTFYQTIDLDTTTGDCDTSTIKWWLSQSQPARDELINAEASESEVLENFIKWIGDDEPYMWGNSAAFDNVILGAVYHRNGIEKPWKYRNDRCYRTINMLFPVEDIAQVGIQHCAIDDAVYQTTKLIKICEKYGLVI